MAATGYHPPQFSEVTAWLPPWLQPQQLPFPDDHTKYVQTNSQLECKNLAYCQENIDDQLDDQFFTSGDAGYNGCHLFLSGEDNSSAGNTSCSPTRLHFQLYLSSEGITQISSCQLHDVLQKRTCESNKGSSREPFPDISVHELDGQYKMDDGTSTANFPPKGCISPLSKRDPSEVPAKCNQYRRKKIQKFDTGNLENADIDGAVELSIAASEALVISELANSGLHSELVSAAAVLEVALRLKQARKCHSDVSEVVAAYPTDELDETDHLCYLDEKMMADAFEDIGISVTQVVRTPDNSSGDKTLQHKGHTTTCSSDAKRCCTSQSNSPNVLSKPISESNCGCATLKQSDGLKAQNFDIYVSRTKSNSDFSMEWRSNDLTEEALLVEQMGPSACAPLDSDTPSIKRQLKAHPHNLVPNYKDSLAANQVILKGIRRALKDGNNATHEDHNIPKGIPKLFIGETSFISESADVITGENISVQGLEAGPEIVASARRSSEDLSAFKCGENKRTHEEVALSQDVVGSSNFSLIDPLCSVVPCSISSDIAGISICGNQNSIEEGEGCLSPTDAHVSLQNLHGNNTLSNTKETSISIMIAQVQGGACNASGESSGMSRKQLSSLKTYSMVTPVQSTYSEGKSLLQNEPSLLIDMTEKIRHLLPDERSDRFMASENEEAAGIPLKLNINYDPSSSGKIETKDHVLSDGPSGSGEPVLDLTGLNVHHDVTVDNICRFKIDQYEKRCSPIVLNCGTRWHLRACNKILSTDNEDEDLKIRRVPKRKRRNRMVNSLNGDSSKDQTDVNSQSPLHSVFQSHPRKKECLPYKRVRFSDAEVEFHVNKTDQRLQSGNETRLCTRTSRVKRSCLRSKSNIGEDKYNCLIPVKDVKGLLFQGLDFLLTGFSRQKEKEIETLIRRHGGVAHRRILSPSSFAREKREERCANQNLPIILSPKKVQTTKFLYGCAINTWMLNANWLSDSVQAGSIMPPGKYLTLQNKHMERKHLLIGQTEYCSSKFIFDKLGIMLYGKTSFCTKFSNIIKHGGGQVFKTLQWLIQSLKNGKNSVGAILVEDENRVSRHLKHCALEHNLPTLPASWIINSLFSDKLLPFKKDRSAPLHRIKMPTFHLPKDIDTSEEI